MENFFEDVSIFQNIREFNTPSGMMQFHLEVHGPVHVYAPREKAWVHQGTFKIKWPRWKAKNKRLYEEFMSQKGEAE